MSQAYAIRSLEEARAYLAHPVLGPRLRESTEALLAADPPARRPRRSSAASTRSRSAASMTLFTRAAPEEQLFTAALARFYGGEADPETDRRL